MDWGGRWGIRLSSHQHKSRHQGSAQTEVGQGDRACEGRGAWGSGAGGFMGTCEGATPSLALRINSLILIPAPFLVKGLVGVPWGVP